MGGWIFERVGEEVRDEGGVGVGLVKVYETASGFGEVGREWMKGG